MTSKQYSFQDTKERAWLDVAVSFVASTGLEYHLTASNRLLALEGEWQIVFLGVFFNLVFFLVCFYVLDFLFPPEKDYIYKDWF